LERDMIRGMKPNLNTDVRGVAWMQHCVLGWPIKANLL
jgi:hypothetical protein